MNKNQKFTNRSSKLKVQRASSQTILSHTIIFSTDIPFFLVSFAFCFSFYQKYTLIHIQLCERVNDKKFFIQPISGNKTMFFFAQTENTFPHLINYKANIFGKKNNLKSATLTSFKLEKALILKSENLTVYYLWQEIFYMFLL